ncbi:MAG: phosphoribosylaminoimidazolesuccinocarboxamide synthase, partial [Gammaproteobacteria bacterium]
MKEKNDTLYRSDIKSLSLINSGKVRDIYHIDDVHMLIVTSDRLSAFDVVLPDPIPGKGKVLTAVSNFWFEKFKHIIPNHLSTIPLSDVLTDQNERAPIEGRGIVVKKLKPLPVEAIVRGYIIGSGWKEYQQTSSVSGITLPQGLLQAEKLSDPI